MFFFLIVYLSDDQDSRTEQVPLLPWISVFAYICCMWETVNGPFRVADLLQSLDNNHHHWWTQSSDGNSASRTNTEKQLKFKPIYVNRFTNISLLKNILPPYQNIRRFCSWYFGMEVVLTNQILCLEHVYFPQGLTYQEYSKPLTATINENSIHVCYFLDYAPN
jgi:hypothetical protein